MRKLTAALAAFALCAALLAGCTDTNGASSGNNNANSGSDPASSGAMADSGDMDTASPDPGMANSGATDGNMDNSDGNMDNNVTGMSNYSAQALDTVLERVLDYGTGTAGVTLKQASAAAELVNFAANDAVTSATLGADTQAWLDTLSDEQKQTLRENWPGVRDMVNSIVTDLDNQTGILNDAGVTYDFAMMDMGSVSAFLNTVDSILGAY